MIGLCLSCVVLYFDTTLNFPSTAEADKIACDFIREGDPKAEGRRELAHARTRQGSTSAKQTYKPTPKRPSRATSVIYLIQVTSQIGVKGSLTPRRVEVLLSRRNCHSNKK